MNEKPKTLKLSKSIMHGTEEITELKFREMTMGDIRKHGIPEKPTEYLELASELTAIPPPILDQMSPKDFIPLVEAIGSFFAQSEKEDG